MWQAYIYEGKGDYNVDVDVERENNDSLHFKLETVELENESLKEINAELEREIEDLKKINADLRENADTELLKENAALKERIEELEFLLNLHTKNTQAQNTSD